jgi:hypothetical protein
LLSRHKSISEENKIPPIPKRAQQFRLHFSLPQTLFIRLQFYDEFLLSLSIFPLRVLCAHHHHVFVTWKMFFSLSPTSTFTYIHSHWRCSTQQNEREREWRKASELTGGDGGGGEREREKLFQNGV